jgi:hypothetical protein
MNHPKCVECARPADAYAAWGTDLDKQAAYLCISCGKELQSKWGPAFTSSLRIVDWRDASAINPDKADYAAENPR